MTVTLDDVKAHLNITSALQDAELQGVLDAAVSVVEGMVGAISAVQYTEVHDGGATSIFTLRRPVLSIQSINEFYNNVAWPLTSEPMGSPADQYGYSLDDPETGQITRRAGSFYPTWFRVGTGNIVITYTAGRTTLPPAIRLAILVIVAELWQTQRGASPLPALGPAPFAPSAGPDWPTSTGIPPLARQLCQSSGLMRTPGIA